MSARPRWCSKCHGPLTASGRSRNARHKCSKCGHVEGCGCRDCARMRREGVRR